MGPGFTKALGHGVGTGGGGTQACPFGSSLAGQDPGNLSGPLCPQVDLGHIYGDNLERQYHLRLFKDGKLKYQVVLVLGESSGEGLPCFPWQRLLGGD